VSVVGTVKLKLRLGVKGDLLLALFPRIDIRPVERNQSSTFFFPPSPFYLLLPFTFLLLPACLLFLLFNLLFYLKMRTYYYEFTVVCDMRPGKHSVTMPLGVKLCALESSACRGNS